MRLAKNEKIIDILQKTLDSVDHRLISHGKRVAYLTYRLLKSQGRHTGKRAQDICLLALMHDIGAYKTDEIDRMSSFETDDIWEHSIYGFLFLKYFSPLSDLAPAICFHHASCAEVGRLEPIHRELAQMLSLCDKADVFAQSGGEMAAFEKFVERYRDLRFGSDILGVFFSSGIELEQLDGDLDSDAGFYEALYGPAMTEREITDYIKMIVLSIDFRSRQTVSHTIAAACITELLARLAGFAQKDIARLKTGALLHDIGKAGIPLWILEKPDRLSPEEMEIMKTHVDMTDKIISGSIDEDIRRVAVRHHEKLDGSGYPRGLRGEDLSAGERIMAVADIFSALCDTRSYKEAYPKERVLGILRDMASRSLLDAEITGLAAANFEYIMGVVNREVQPVAAVYDEINGEYERLLEKTKNYRSPAELGGMLDKS